jgi:hypothetical protein
VNDVAPEQMTLYQIFTLYKDSPREQQRDLLFSYQIHAALKTAGLSHEQASRLLTYGYQVANRTRIKGNYADIFRFMAQPFYIITGIELAEFVPEVETHDGPYGELAERRPYVHQEPLPTVQRPRRKRGT